MWIRPLFFHLFEALWYFIMMAGSLGLSFFCIVCSYSFRFAQFSSFFLAPYHIESYSFLSCFFSCCLCVCVCARVCWQARDWDGPFCVTHSRRAEMTILRGKKMKIRREKKGKKNNQLPCLFSVLFSSVLFSFLVRRKKRRRRRQRRRRISFYASIFCWARAEGFRDNKEAEPNESWRRMIATMSRP